MGRISKLIGISIASCIGLVYLYAYIGQLRVTNRPERILSVPKFIAEVNADKLQRVTIYPGGVIKGWSAHDPFLSTTRIPPNYTKIYELLDQKSIDYSVATEGFPWEAFLAGAVAMLMIIGIGRLFQRTQPGR